MSPPRCTRSDEPITFCNGGLDHPMTQRARPQRARSFTRLAGRQVRTCPDMPGGSPPGRTGGAGGSGVLTLRQQAEDGDHHAMPPSSRAREPARSASPLATGLGLLGDLSTAAVNLPGHAVHVSTPTSCRRRRRRRACPHCRARTRGEKVVREPWFPPQVQIVTSASHVVMRALTLA